MQTLLNLFFMVLVSFSFTTTTGDLVGQWSGGLNVQGNTLRIVFHVNSSADGYEATFDSLDQNVKNIPVTKVTYDFPNVRFESAALGMVFDGKLAGDQIEGTWKQSGMSFGLTLSRDKYGDDK